MIYVVAPGDTLSGIARLSGSSVAQLQQDNGILPDQPLVPGQALVVPDRDGTASEKPLLSVGGYAAYPTRRLAAGASVFDDAVHLFLWLPRGRYAGRAPRPLALAAGGGGRRRCRPCPDVNG
mgnify:CR=1 FL=1